jgi:hypothetical protein
MNRVLLILLIVLSPVFAHAEAPLITLSSFLSGMSCDRPGLVDHLKTAFVSSETPSVTGFSDDSFDNVRITTTRFTVWLKGHEAPQDQFVLELRIAESYFDANGKPIKPIDGKTRELKLIGYRVF